MYNQEKQMHISINMFVQEFYTRLHVNSKLKYYQYKMIR
jgi:hypothetical protein